MNNRPHLTIASKSARASSDAHDHYYGKMQKALPGRAGTKFFGNPDMLPVRQNAWGYIDLTGKLAIKPQFIFANDFAEGLAAVLPPQNTKWGFIDRSGNFAIPPQFDQVDWAFSEGLAAVEISKKWGFIDQRGGLAVPLKYDKVDTFSETLSSVVLGAKAGFVDRSGNEVIPLRYDGAGFFSEGTAVVNVDGKSIYIDKQGTQIIAASFAQAGPFREGRAWFQQAKGQPLGFMDKNGAVVVPPKFDFVFSFSEGFAIVHTGGTSGKWYYIDRAGKQAFSAKFRIAEAGGSDFSEGLSGIGPDDKFGYIDHNGKMIIGAQFSNVGPFLSGVASVQVKFPAFGYIDVSGRYIWSPTW
jgi:hypothetical protein